MTDIEISRADRRKSQSPMERDQMGGFGVGYRRGNDPLLHDQRTGAGERRVADREWMNRCDICNWPLAKTVAEGCVPFNCSMRPVPQHHADVAALKQSFRRLLALRRERPGWDVEKAQAELQRQALAAACAWATGQDATFDAEAIFKAGGGGR